MLKRYLWLHFAFGCVASAAIFCIVYYTAWLRLQNVPESRARQRYTSALLHLFAGQISDYQEVTGELPVELDGIRLIQEGIGPGWLHIDAGTQPRDAWGRPFYYESDGDSFQIYSFGRDGTPGGSGVDADLNGAFGRDGDLEPSLQQFLTTTDENEIAGNGVLAWALVSALITFGMVTIAIVQPIAYEVIHSNGTKSMSQFGEILERHARGEFAHRDDLGARINKLIDPTATIRSRVNSGLVLLFFVLMISVFAFVITTVLCFLHVESSH